MTPEKANLYRRPLRRASLVTGIFESAAYQVSSSSADGSCTPPGACWSRHTCTNSKSSRRPRRRQRTSGWPQPKAVGQIYPFVHGMADKPKAVNIALDLRGNPRHGDQCHVPSSRSLVLRTRSLTRREAAASDWPTILWRSPIASRVWVNRVWKWHFGTGIVNTPDNFGAVGDPPSNPAAARLSGGPVPRERDVAQETAAHDHALCRLSAEQQGDARGTRQRSAQNRYYSHFHLQRLDAEQLRDSMLFVAGDLDAKDAGGPDRARPGQRHADGLRERSVASGSIRSCRRSTFRIRRSRRNSVSRPMCR